MALPDVTVQKLNSETYRVLWNRNSKCINGAYEYDKSSFNSFFKVDLKSLGVDECYEIASCLVKNVNGYYCPSLTVSLATINENNVKQRKYSARFFGREKEMIFTSSTPVSGEKVTRCSWRAQWNEISRIGCPFCHSSLGMAETFEILIDMDPTNALKLRQQSVLSQIAHLWESKTLADVTFRCQNTDIKAHSCIVSSASPVLAAMFQNDFKEKQERIVVIKEIKADVFEKLLHFTYTGKLDLEFNDISALFRAADMYDIVPLKEQCEEFLSRSVILENATSFLILSHLHNAAKLNIATLNYMKQNSEAICCRPDWMSLLKNYPELGFTAVQFMVKKDVDQTKEN